ncbi:MAG: thermonuclease family protein [Cyanobacteria bacterium K_Offshore_surface_m2_239]|nr:thermonuclease family protein [Cyanobacteria bacterium K_Offshore_surface_m2_239]
MVLFTSAIALSGTALAATVIAVDSGDTLRVREGGQVSTIRLACLDAPELGQGLIGAQAKATLAQLAPVGTAVRVTPLTPHTPLPETKAANGVVTAEVATSASVVNVELVRAGQAFTTLDAQPRCDPLSYAEAENSARFRRMGVWQVEGGSERPWQWRVAAAEAKARAARQRAVEAQQARERQARPPRVNAAPPNPSLLAAGPVTSMPGFQKQCVASGRQRYLEFSQGIAPPPGSFEAVCACISKPKPNETVEVLTERCTNQYLQRFMGRM